MVSTVENSLAEARLRGIKVRGYDSIENSSDYSLQEKLDKLRNIPASVVDDKANESRKIYEAKTEKKNQISGTYKPFFEREADETINLLVDNIVNQNITIRQKIRLLLGLRLPLEVAKVLGIPSKRVFDEIDLLSKEEDKDIKKEFISNRVNVKRNIAYLRKIGLSSNDALGKIYQNVPPELLIELAEIYFIIGEHKKAIRILSDNGNIQDANSQHKITSKREELEEESRAVRIRLLVKANKQNKRETSYKSLCETFGTSMEVVKDILGEEDRDYN